MCFEGLQDESSFLKIQTVPLMLIHNTGALLPGILVNARVKAVLSDGLLVSFLTYFTGRSTRFI